MWMIAKRRKKPNADETPGSHLGTPALLARCGCALAGENLGVARALLGLSLDAWCPERDGRSNYSKEP